MKRYVLTMAVLAGTLTTFAQGLIKESDMETKSTALRLVYPQWQGGIIDQLVTELAPEDASKGYYLGAHLLNFLAPKASGKTIEVPISLDINDRKMENGISAYQVILKQTKAALDVLNVEKPERILTLGGECAVSVVPFSYLAAKYPDDMAIVWIDAHPDINLPHENYAGYHAMALAACFGKGDSVITSMLPGKVDPKKAALVGIRSWEEGMQERQHEWGITGFSVDQVANTSAKVLKWLESTGVSKVAIHFDMDVLDPAEIIAAVGTDPDGMKIQQAVRVINDIAAKYDVVSLTVAEPMPRVAIKLRNMLKQLPLMK